MNQENKKQKGLYGRAAEDGLVLGVFISILAIAMLLTARYGWLALICVAMIIALPFLVYRMMKQPLTKGLNPGFSAIWMHGISIFIFGSLIMGLAVYLYLRVADPDYIMRTVRLAIQALRQLGGDDNIETAKKLAYMYDHHLMPTAIQMAFTAMWFAAFSGSLLSLILTYIVRRPNKTLK